MVLYLQHFIVKTTLSFVRKTTFFFQCTVNTLNDFLKKHGIKHEYSAPYTPEQNGVSERMNQTLLGMARCLIIDSGLNKKFWGEAVNTSCYLLNRLPFNNNLFSPYEKWHGYKPNLSHIRIFGSDAFVFIPDVKRSKLDNKSEKLKLVGYSETSKAYRLLNVNNNKITLSRNVRFIEKIHKQEEHDTKKRDEKFDFDDEIELQLHNTTSETNTVLDDQESNSDTETDVDSVFEEDYLTRVEPKNYKDMLKFKDSENWKVAMDEEIKSMIDNNVWELVMKEDYMKIISTRWVYKL